MNCELEEFGLLQGLLIPAFAQEDNKSTNQEADLKPHNCKTV